MKEKIVLPLSSFDKRIEIVSERGSLGLLALGAIGLIAWRKKREEVKASKSINEKS
jgi:hypothetical protein